MRRLGYSGTACTAATSAPGCPAMVAGLDGEHVIGVTW
jgi:hypothetical protein